MGIAMENVVVSVLCTAYNHEKYIARCIESIVGQCCKYDFELLIHDDASTDRTREIIEVYASRYPEIIRPIYQKENCFSRGISITNTEFLPRARGKYFAICEGDDYWCDQEKLEKQVSFLESHDEYTAVVHAGKYINEDGSETGNLFQAYPSSRDVKMEDAIERWLVPTASFVYRSRLMRSGNPIKGNAPCGDVPLLLFLLLEGKVKYMNEVMSAYRLNSESSISRALIEGGVEKQIARVESLIDFYRRFDSYSNHKFKNSVDAKCASLRLDEFLYSGNRIYLNEPAVKELHKRLSLRIKMVAAMNRNIPGIVRRMSKIRQALSLKGRSSG